MFLSACRTTPKFDYQYAYHMALVRCSVSLETLQAFDAGDVDKARIVALSQVNGGLMMLHDIAAKVHPEPWQKEEQLALAKGVLDYMFVHRAEIDLRWGVNVSGLKAMLTDPEDLRRLAELEVCLARAEEKIRESNQKGISAEDHQANQSDAEISQKIVGTWIVDIDELPAFSAKGTETFASDGSYVVKTTFIRHGKQREVQFEGKWQIKDGFLIGTNFMHDRNKILRVDDNELVSLVEGNLSTLKRSK
jgi:hypothetical protein